MKYFAGTYQGNVSANIDVLPLILQKIHEINSNYNICSMEIYANVFNGELALTLTEHTTTNNSAKVSFNDYSTAVMILNDNLSGGYSFRYYIDKNQDITKLVFNYPCRVQINYIVSDFNQ